MKIAVVGGGAMGSIYAALLALSSNDVVLVDRGEERVQMINTRGLRLEGPLGDRRASVRAFLSAPCETMDLVVLAVKANDVETAAHAALPMLSAQTIVLAIQNGLGSADAVASAVGANHLAVGIASGFGASVLAPGHVHHNAMQAVRMGAYGSLAPQAIEKVARVWREAGFDAEAVSDIQTMQWEKLICNVAYSAPCALTGMTVGQIMKDPDMARISRAAATEAWRVARALGVGISVQDPVAHAWAFGDRMPTAKPSALQDMEAGRRSEIDVINGAVPRYGALAGIDAPVNETLARLVKAREKLLQKKALV
ncbi:ketopantoate reductase family protein [Ottowia sp. VDI28]|uniref:ketopantoate reductase family protein n=1 Tax=Ottowia sp. VDI28 TaxID=3133968 RepID=UPI003C2D05C0